MDNNNLGVRFSSDLCVSESARRGGETHDTLARDRAVRS